MKKLLYIFLMLSFISCEKDDSTTTSTPMGNNNNNNNSASWNCNPASGCYDPGDGNGTYSSLSDCETDCGGVTSSFNCIAGSCVDPGTGNGTYSTLAACVSNCGSGGNDIDPTDFYGQWDLDDMTLNGISMMSPGFGPTYIVEMTFLFQSNGQVIVTQTQSDDPIPSVYNDQWSVSGNILLITHADGSQEQWTIIDLNNTSFELQANEDGIEYKIYASN